MLTRPDDPARAMVWPPALELSELDSGVVTVTERAPLQPRGERFDAPAGPTDTGHPSPARAGLRAVGWRAYAIGALSLLAVGEAVIIGLQQRAGGVALPVASPVVLPGAPPAASAPAPPSVVIPPPSASVAPLPAPAAPAVGWVTVNGAVDVDVWVGRRRLGTAGDGRLELAAGDHRLEFVNDQLGVRLVEPVRIVRGRVTTVSPVFPDGVLHLNAAPWAEVVLNGRLLGTTPLANVSVPLGDHDLLFRHPELGARTVRVRVTAGAPVRTGVNMREPQE